MSGGLMSCVRENSPPLEMDINVSGPLSLPEPSINNSDLMGSVHSSSHHNIASSTPLAAQISSHYLDGSSSGGGGGDGGCGGVGGAACSTPIATPPNTEQTKRRRFHPLRNLRRIFRRRTITSATTAAAETPTATITTATTAASSNSEKNLRSATLSSITSVASASSPSSPLTHQQLQDAYLTQSLPKSKSAYSSLLGGGGGGSKKHQSHDYNINAESKGKTKHKHKNQKHQQQQQQQSKELDFERYQQQQLQQQQNAEDMFGTTTQTSANYHHQNVQHYAASTAAAGGAMTSKSSLLSQRQSMGVAVFPGAINRSFFTERQKLRSVGDSSQDLDSGSGNDSGTGGGHNSSAMERVKNNGGSASGGEMSDSQRSLSEGRLVDSDYSRDGLSQSHDSVFSESATASSLSIVLKAELADVLRKRRNRPDASDEDLGLPRSPASPQRRGVANNHSQNYVPATATASSSASKSTMAEKHSGEVSSLSLLSMNSTDGEDLLSNTTATTTSVVNNSTTSAATTTTTEIVQEQRTSAARYSRSSTMSSISMSSDILRQRDLSSFNDTKDEVDLFSSDWQRLSHSAAKHKMAIRPTKKKGGPSRQHRRTLETSIPEANEDLNRTVHKQTQEFKDLETRAKTRSLPPGVNAAKLLEETHTATAKESTSKATKTNNTMTPQTVNTTTTTTTTTTSSNLFGLRNLTAKASAMFESKDTQPNEETNKKSNESSKKSDSVDKPSQQLVGESSESGFLRRLMHRNSKRSIARVNNGDEDQDELDKKQNEPKKMQMSNTSSHIEQSKSHEFVMYESCVEEKRKEIKKEIYNEGKTMGLTTISNSFAISAKEERKLEDKSPAKPKSGPAARQRYLPQNISNEDLIKINEEKSVSKESILSKSSLTNESFQSTSLIREITKQQNQQQLTATTTTTTSPIKSDHHFEKNPKIVGLSAFQQKVSRSNDSFARSSSNNISTVSLDKSEEDLMATTTRNMQAAYEQKQRKSVEKSRSFRAYGEQKDSLTSPTVHNNMPSLPDLSLNLRVPFYKDFLMHEKEYSSPSPPEMLDEKHTSLGFEINDNKLVKPDARDIRKSFTSYDKNIILTTTTTASNNTGNTPNKTTPTKLLASSTIVSPFASSSSMNSCNKNITEIENNIDMIVKSPFVSVIRKSINLSEEQAEDVIKITTMPPSTCLTEKVRPTVLPLKKEKSLSEENMLNSPSMACVTLRDKQSKKINNLYSNSMENNTKDHFERKSVPAVKTSNGFRSNSTRRSSSVVESTQADKPRSTVPEFMKIQLNRVEPCRTSKSHVVLAKNVKETPLPPARETTPEKHNNSSSSMDDLSFRRLSSESVDINERETSPETEKRFTGLYHEAINKQAKLCTGLPPKSPNKKLPTTPTTPPTPTINDRDAIVFETTSSNTLPSSNTNSLSLQERKRLFMMEERTKMEKKMEEIRFERKKSICDEVNKKTVTKASESGQQQQRDKELSPSDNNNCVILRKKSFASSVQSLNGNNQGPTNKDDATPELMKVFARRSLKIKDEDLDKILNSNGCCSHNMSSAPQTLKKFNSIPAPAAANPNLDSDKENQSASDEKLDKLPKLDAAQASTLNKSHNTTQLLSATTGNCNNNNNNNNNIGCNRNSLADFRLAGSKANHSALATNNNINNNNCNSNAETTAKSNSFLPPIKMVGVGLGVGVAGFRAMSIERNNNHNNCAVLSPAKAASSTLERPTLKLGDLSSSSSTDDPIITISKTIERSATIGEFKGIHQRRAEWEQRAKEALK